MNNKIGTLIWISWNIFNVVYTSSVPRSDYGELKLFGAPASYAVDTTVLLNDASRRDKEVGYKIRATLELAPAWSDGHSEFLFKFDLLSPQLHSRSTHISADFIPQKSVWDKHAQSTFYAHWKNGLIQAAYLDDSEPVEITNYKKSLISLFQFQIIDGENNETDISGTCRVLYETLSMQNIRKIKSGCESGEAGVAGSGEGMESRRVHSYTLSAALDALDELYAEELHTAGDAAASFALRARAWQRLTRAPSAPAPAPPAPAGTLAAALGALPAALAPHSLQLLPSDDSFQDEMDVKSAWAAAAEALADEAAGEGGTAAAARATLLALPAVRGAPRAALLALLQGEREAGRLRALLRLLALAAAPAAHAAAAAFLQLRDPDPDPLADLARSYFAALAHADRPHEEVVLDALRLGGSAHGERAGALLAAAAAAPRASPAAARAVRDALLRHLAACQKEECYVSRLEALGNLRRADTADTLLAHAAAGSGRAALAALRALRALPAAALRHAARLDRLEALACNARSFHVRGAALDLLVARSAAAPLRLERVAHALHSPHAELRRLFWQRLRALAPRSAPVRQLLALLPPRLTGWHAQAIAGTSSVLERELPAAGERGGRGGWGGRRARLESVQLARGGLLRAGRVALLAADAADSTDAADAEDEPITVELWTRGLEALSGGEGEGEGEGEGAAQGGEGPVEGAAAGLLLAVSGARLPAITLFSGQAELLGHVWAGRGSEPTNVLRAVRPLPTRAGLTPLCAGALLRWRHRAARALALDAHAQASLWSRSARAGLELRAALAAELRARVSSASAALSAAAELSAEPRLRIGADLDFYDGVTLCVRAESAAHAAEQALRLDASLGERPARRVRRRQQRAWAAPGRTLALGAPNDLACRALGSSDA